MSADKSTPKQNANKRGKLLILLVIAILVAVFFAFDLEHYLTLEYLKSEHEHLLAYYHHNQLLMIGIYFAAYVIVTALSLPGAAIMTLAGGAVFGLLVGTVVVSFASTIGATLAFLASRFILHDTVQRRFGDKLHAINEGVRREGAFYLFTLRLIPLFPFFVINLVMGLTPMRVLQYIFVSQIGMLPGTIVYVNAGDQIAGIESLKGILSPSLLLSFALLGLFPLIAKKIIDTMKARKLTKRYRKPRRFEYNMVVIGAGSAGLVSAYIASTLKAKVALIEKHEMGGDCLNTGCVPSKALIQSARMAHAAKRAADFGFKHAQVEFEFAEVMERVQHVIQKVAPHDSVERYRGLGVDVITGEARIRSPYEVEVNGRVLTTRNIVIATGARPMVPLIEGIEQIDVLTSDTVWQLRERPKKLLVLGGGPIGCELAQCFQRLGSQVTVIDRHDVIMNREDREISAMVMDQFREDGIEMLVSHQAKRFEINDGQPALVCEAKGGEVRVEFDKVLVALGRKANVTGFGLEELEVYLSSRGTIEADPFLRTNYPNIYVCGDVTGPYQFTHMASHQAWYAAVNALFSPLKKFRVNYSVVPWTTFTDPEVARVGLNESEAMAKGISYEVTTYGIDDLDRAIADTEDRGLVKVLTVPGKDKILGVTISGAHAGELIAEFVLAMTHGLGLNKILGTIHVYPTMAEANKYVAGNWKKAHKPEQVLRWLERFHAWRRHDSANIKAQEGNTSHLQ
jgi:pyruvate/2-oxoglutarate dehydrogenase complex dihydrolipoamide dehydrogenase (E3) component/uncharacterized membrane protein YdjX (TVP38/TMEM64 family)